MLGLGVALRELGEFERAAEVNAEAIERAGAAGLDGVAARGRLKVVFTGTRQSNTPSLDCRPMTPSAVKLTT